MIRLYTSWFSPFARKVALGLELKGLPYHAVDALRRDFRHQLLALNPRGEVPVLVEGEVTVVNSPDILQYLDARHPEPPLYPRGIADQVLARSLERLADHRFDPLVVNRSYWSWADRPDAPPPGLHAAAQADLDEVLTRLEAALAPRPRPWPFGAPGVLECAWFPNLVALRPLGLVLDEQRHPNVAGWLAALRDHPVFAADRRRTAQCLKTLASDNHERHRLFWSGDRIEWLVAHGFHRWFTAEIEAGRAVFPG